MPSEAHPGSAFCPLCIDNRRGRSNHNGHWGFRPVARVGCIPGGWNVKKPNVQSAASLSGVSGQDEQFSGLYPTLWEHLTTTEWEDKSVRQTSTMTVFVEDGQVKLCLNDRSLERTCWVSGGSFMAALHSLEEGLRLDRVDWRGRPGQGQRRKK